MSAYAGLRISVAVALLNRGAANRVGVVAAPDLRKIAEDSEVKAVAARGAALKENLRKRPCQLVHNAVKSADITVRRFTLTLAWQIRREHV